MYGAIVLIAMNYIAPAIIIFIVVAFAIYWYMEFNNEAPTQLDMMKSALGDYSPYSLEIMGKIIKRGLSRNSFDVNSIEVDTEAIRNVLRYYLDSLNLK